MIEDFHFIRPWCLGLIPMGGLLAWIWSSTRDVRNAWFRLGDPEIIRYSLLSTTGESRRWHLWGLAVVWLFASVAMAGPAWNKIPVPTYQAERVLLLVLDLSASMDATDIEPNRLTRSKFKIRDILKSRREGQTGLIVFAGDAFVVTPITDDNNTILNLLDALDTRLMPNQGSNADRALVKAGELIKQSGSANVDILLFTDGVNEAAMEQAASLAGGNHRILVLAVGTPEAAPIPTREGGFLKDREGKIVFPHIDLAQLQELALLGKGRFARLKSGDGDIEYLLGGAEDLSTQFKATERSGDQWQDMGPWLLLPLLLPAALLFRRGWFLSLPLLTILLPVSDARAFSWSDLWLRGDQQAARALRQNDTETALRKSTSDGWRGSAHYRAENYLEAAERFSQGQSPVDYYNAGNALAKAGHLQQALAAYDEALQKDPEMSDARHNRALIQQMLEQQQQQQNDQQGEPQAHQPGQPQQDNRRNQGADRSTAANEPEPQSSKTDASEGQNPQQQSSPTDRQQASQPATEQQQAEESKQRRRQQDDDGGRQEDLKLQARHADREGQTPDSASRTDLENQRATALKLREVPDDPGGLLRRKFLYQYRKRQGEQSHGQDW